MTPEEIRYVDVGVIARRFSVTVHTVRNWITIGKLIAIRTPTGRYKIPFSELTRLQKEGDEREER